eukprot:gene11006-19846_t
MASSDSESSYRTASSGCSESEYESDSTSGGGNVPHIQPYMFEPKRAVAEKELAGVEDGEDDDGRFGNSDRHM